jgi:hypothetical protein
MPRQKAMTLVSGRKQGDWLEVDYTSTEKPVSGRMKESEFLPATVSDTEVAS